jgi:hypothetical protein
VRDGLTVREILREKGTPYAELGLADPTLTNEQLFDAIETHPILINRPLVVTQLGVRFRPTQGRTLAVMQVCGGSQSFNAVNALRVPGRWMRMVRIPNQLSLAKAWQEFDANGRMKPSSHYARVVDVMEELYQFTLLMRMMKWQPMELEICLHSAPTGCRR